ncbi:M3 family metallopeptidase [uncultured Duncaniella sp.]|jgi:peptidyl-dipeptidase Dcp|uniref:M3 family peptidase n=10 Tax=Duncaniella TaxID=2518495 RepID=A0A4Z0VBB0_9BACT|nr:M3 family metallopeptidase [uncultured Duncaniella sp.]TGG40462.1 M3 family peptidase [Duncaniella freteri]
MRKTLLTAVAVATSIMTQAQNPFFEEFKGTPHGTAPFDRISLSHYEPAIDRGIKLGLQGVDKIVNNPEAPTFENTIVALENAGQDLDRVLNVFYPLESAMSDDAFMELSVKITPRLSEYSTSISLNEGLWERIKTVYDNADTTRLSPEDRMLLKRTYESFTRKGALLQGADREKYSKLSSRLSELTTTFGQNTLKELNTYKIWLKAEDLDGLTESAVEAAALAAKENGREGEYLFTLDAPVYSAFMKNSSRRDLREKMWRLYSGRNIKGEYNNIPVMKEIAETRLAIANLLGYRTYADYSLANTMAAKTENVYKLLNSLRDAYKPAQKAEFAELEAFATKMEGKPMQLKPWDYSYYSNKLRNAKYSYDEEELRPYFELNNVIDGVFGLATRLYGVKFVKNPDIPVYHPDVTAFDVKDEDGSYLGVIYTDFFPRASKRAGAWMTEFKGQRVDEEGNNSRPHVTIVMNFTKPTSTKPSLLTPSEVETFLHEFGHALHGLLADSKYGSLAGTNVLRDFVELPSQFNENYLTEKEFLDGFAKHYETGKPIPSELIDRIVASSQYGAAYACFRQLGFGMLDLAWHTITAPVQDPEKFENEALESVSMFEPIAGTMFAPTFGHIFSGGYAAGYYSYKWAEVLDADAFAHFKEHGIFDRATADSFRKNILSRGGTEDPAELYRRFRGHDATIDALLKRDGIEPSASLPDNDLHRVD